MSAMIPKGFPVDSMWERHPFLLVLCTDEGEPERVLQGAKTPVQCQVLQNMFEYLNPGRVVGIMWNRMEKAA